MQLESLILRVFAIEVLDCPECGSRLRKLAAVHSPDTTTAMLDCLGLPSRAPPVAPAQREPVTIDW